MQCLGTAVAPTPCGCWLLWCAAQVVVVGCMVQPQQHKPAACSDGAILRCTARTCTRPRTGVWPSRLIQDAGIPAGSHKSWPTDPHPTQASPPVPDLLRPLQWQASVTPPQEVVEFLSAAVFCSAPSWRVGPELAHKGGPLCVHSAKPPAPRSRTTVLLGFGLRNCGSVPLHQCALVGKLCDGPSTVAGAAGHSSWRCLVLTCTACVELPIYMLCAVPCHVQVALRANSCPPCLFAWMDDAG